MKKSLKICSIVLMILFMIFGLYLTAPKISFGQHIATATGSASTSNSTKPTNDAWKIELNENTQTGSHEFDFIQKNLASADLTDNGHFLLIAGIILVVLGIAGVIFFSFCLYKLSKNTKRHLKKGGATRYK